MFGVLGVNERVLLLNEILHESIAKHTPVYNTKVNNKYPNWFNSKLKKLLKSKKSLRKAIKKSGNNSMLTTNAIKLKSVKSETKKELQECHKQKINTMENNLNYDPKGIWKYINTKKNNNNLPGAFMINNELIDDNDIILNNFVKTFSLIYEPLNQIEINLTNRHNIDNLNELIFSDNNIIKAFKYQTLKLTSGTDQLPSLFLKMCAPALIEPIKLIAKKALLSGIYPDQWKEAKILPVYKSGSKLNINNYRQIAILCNYSKIIEICIYKYIITFIAPVLTEHQHGFTPNKSTITNLITSTQLIYNSFNNNAQVDIIYMDFAKAFDKIDIYKFLIKINNLRVPIPLTQLLKSYMTNRKNKVTYNGKLSTPYIPTSGVPQGSNLGPLLFLIFINDIVQDLKCHVSLFADDTKIYWTIKNETGVQFLQYNLNLFYNWCNENSLFLNLDKCQVVTYHKIKNPIIFEYKLNNTSLKRGDSVKDLGIQFDKSLTFNIHIETIINKAKRILGFVMRICKDFEKQETLVKLFETLVRSILEYGLVIWDPIHKKYKNKIEKIQRKFIKWVEWKLTGYYPARGSNIDHLYTKYKLIKLTKRRLGTNAIFGLKILKGIIYCPTILSEIPIRLPSTTRSTLPLYQQNINSVYKEKAPIQRIITAINYLSENSNNILDILDFKQKIELHDITEYLN